MVQNGLEYYLEVDKQFILYQLRPQLALSLEVELVKVEEVRN